MLTTDEKWNRKEAKADREEAVALPYLYADSRCEREKLKELRPENKSVYAEQDKMYKCEGMPVNVPYDGLNSDRKNRDDLENLRSSLVWSLQLISYIHIPDEERVKLKKDWARVLPQPKRAVALDKLFGRRWRSLCNDKETEKIRAVADEVLDEVERGEKERWRESLRSQAGMDNGIYIVRSIGLIYSSVPSEKARKLLRATYPKDKSVFTRYRQWYKKVNGMPRRDMPLKKVAEYTGNTEDMSLYESVVNTYEVASREKMGLGTRMFLCKMWGVAFPELKTKVEKLFQAKYKFRRHGCYVRFLCGLSEPKPVLKWGEWGWEGMEFLRDKFRKKHGWGTPYPPELETNHSLLLWS